MSAPEERFTVKEVVVAMREEMHEGFRSLNAKLDAKSEQTQADDHERRLRSLERFRYAIPSAAVLSVMTAIALAVTTFVFHY